MNHLILESEKLILKTLDLSFLSNEYVNWMNDVRVNKYLENSSDYNLNKLEKYLSNIQDNKILAWAIIIKRTKKHIGNIKIDPVDFKNSICRYGIMMGDTNEWGKGYAKKASQLVTEYCFDTLNLREIYLGVIEENKAAFELYKKLNFIVSGKWDPEYVNYDGINHRIIRMSLVNKNYRKVLVNS